MKAHIEPITFVIRILEDEDECYKDPYFFSTTLIRVDRDTVKFMGVDKKITIKMWRAMDVALSEAGFKYFTFERCNSNGKKRTTLRKLRGAKHAG